MKKNKPTKNLNDVPSSSSDQLPKIHPLVKAEKKSLLNNEYYRSVKDNVLRILRDSACQGCVAILSLIFTIFLTLYIFYYTQSQQTANTDIFMTIDQIDTDSWNVFVEVNNNGPSVANNVFLNVYDNNLNCTFSSSNNIGNTNSVSYINPSQQESSEFGVSARYEKILPNQTGAFYFNVRISSQINDQVVSYSKRKYWSSEDEKKGFDFINRNVFKIEIDGENMKMHDAYVVIIGL